MQHSAWGNSSCTAADGCGSPRKGRNLGKWLDNPATDQLPKFLGIWDFLGSIPPILSRLSHPREHIPQNASDKFPKHPVTAVALKLPPGQAHQLVTLFARPSSLFAFIS